MKIERLTSRAPGRINIIGDHTDYNMGLVLPAAINRYIETKLQRNRTNSINVIAKDINAEYSFDLNRPTANTKGWENYLIGVVRSLQQQGAQLEGFDAEFSGNIPIGSGLSSSAALESSLAWGLNHLFQLGFSRLEIAKIGQLAEHEYVGVQCGLMDQFTSMHGKSNHAIKLDCRTNAFDYVPIDLGDYEFILLNTNVSHSLADSDYNTRRQECEEAVAIIGQQIDGIYSMRDVRLQDLIKFQNLLAPNIYKRAKHVIMENNRVIEASKSLIENDLVALGQNLNASHKSLRDDYAVSCPELDYLVQQAQLNPAVLGSRMMGGGFGGCTINLIKKGVTDFIEPIFKAYKHEFSIELSPYRIELVDGAEVSNEIPFPN